MNRQERKNLLLELNKKLKQEKISGSQKKEIIVGKSKGVIFTISKNYIDQLVAIHKFLKDNKEITEQDFNNLLKTTFINFGFVKKLNRTMPDFLNELKTHGPMWIAKDYVYNKHIDKELERRLP